PFVVGAMPNYDNRQISGNASGPLGKKLSWFLDLNTRKFNTAQLIKAETLGPAPTFTPTAYNATFPTPSTSYSIDPRIDYAINTNNTLVVRFGRQVGSSENGVGNFSLPTQEIFGASKYTNVRATETWVIGTKSVNEVLFALNDSRQNSSAAGFSGPTISVPGAFTSGGSAASNYNRNRSYELQENNTITAGKHTLKAGARMRWYDLQTQSTSNFNGTYSFSTPQNPAAATCFNGTFDPNLPALTSPTSIQDYQYTQIAMQDGKTMSQIVGAGCGPTGFSLNAGPTQFAQTQFDAGIYAQDDWRVRPNLTISPGLRFETQTNVNDTADLAPRLSLSWAPGAKPGKTGKTVLRGGVGTFYDRFSVNSVLNTIRYNGTGQQNYSVNITSGSASGVQALSYYGVGL